MFSKRDEEEQSHWISFTDLVSGFMIVFIVVSLVALGQINPKPPIEPNTTEGKYKEITENFANRLSGWQAVEIADNATIRFSVKSTSPSPLFRPTQSRPTAYFISILDRFLPIYFDEMNKLFLQQDSQNFVIHEIRIEGHTDPAGIYLQNLALSSNRALEVQKYILQHPEMRKYNAGFQKFMEKNSIACGYSFSRTLDSNGRIVDPVKDRKVVNFDKSRRVEFRILLEYKN